MELAWDPVRYSPDPAWLVLTLLLVLFLSRRWLAGWYMTRKAASLTPALSRLLSRLVHRQDYDLEGMLRADGAEGDAVARRARGLERLRSDLGRGRPLSDLWSEHLRDGMSDLRFTDANRVPFPFARVMRECFDLSNIAVASSGPQLQDADGNWSLDVSGSYGVNVAGNELYKEWTDQGWDLVRDLGPAVLGPLHPVVADNVKMLKALSGLDEVSFHMSGTEAVMAAVRLARFNTGRKQVVCFAGAYHGWWDGVQPGLGSERDIGDVITLKEMNTASLGAIRHRARDIAAVLVNPVQSFHPNSPPPNDAVLLDSDVRRTGARDTEYARWLKRLREVCDECGVPLVFDEVYSGFRLAPGGAQQYFGVQADMVVYGKTLGGGMPTGVVCGRRELMRRFDPERPMRIAYVVGTFSAHPLVMATMNQFLQWVTMPDRVAGYERANARCDAWVRETNEALAAEQLPVRVENLATIWTVQFTQPGRYNWLLQYYLRAEGITLSWVGTGRCVFSHDFNDEDLRELRVRLLRAARRMQADRWWLAEEDMPDRERAVKTRVALDMLRSLVKMPRPLHGFYAEIMRRKHDDHVASHSHRTNQFLHLVSSSLFIFCYVTIFTNLVVAMWTGLLSLLIRQTGHALIEPPCHDKEQLLLGFDTRSKTFIVAGFLALPAWTCYAAPVLDWPAFRASLAADMAIQWFWYTTAVILGRVLWLVHEHGFYNSMVWFVKLVTDPFTDIKAYYRSAARPV